MRSASTTLALLVLVAGCTEKDAPLTPSPGLGSPLPPAAPTPPILFEVRGLPDRLLAIDVANLDRVQMVSPTEPAAFGLGPHIGILAAPHYPFPIAFDGRRNVGFEPRPGEAPQQLMSWAVGQATPILSRDRRLAMSWRDGEEIVVRVWPISETRPRDGFVLDPGDLRPTRALQWTADTWALVGGHDNTFLVWQVDADGSVGAPVRCEGSPPTVLAGHVVWRSDRGLELLSPSGARRTIELPGIGDPWRAYRDRLLVGTTQGLELFDLAEGSRTSFPGYGSWGLCDSGRFCSSDGPQRYVVVRTDFDRRDVLDLGSGEIIEGPELPTRAIAAVDDDGERLITFDPDAANPSVSVWRLSDGVQLHTWPLPARSEPAQLSADGRALQLDLQAPGSRDVFFGLLDLETGASRTVEGRFIGFMNHHATFVPWGGLRLEIGGPGRPTRSLLDVPGQFTWPIMDEEGHFCVQDATSTTHILDPLADPPLLLQANLQGWWHGNSDSVYWFVDRGDDTNVVTAFEANHPERGTRTSTIPHGALINWQARRSLLLLTEDGEWLEVGADAVARPLDLPSFRSPTLHLADGDDAPWVLHHDGASRLGPDAEVDTEILGDFSEGHRRLKVAAGYVYVFDPSNQGSARVARLGQTGTEGRHLPSRAAEMLRGFPASFDAAGRLLVPTGSRLEAIGYDGEEILLESHAPLVSIWSRGEAWVAAAEGGLWVGPTRWIPVPRIEDSPAGRWLDDEVLTIWSGSLALLIDVRRVEVRRAPELVAWVSHRLEDGHLIVRLRDDRLAVWDLDGDRLSLLREPGPESVYVLRVLPR